MANRIITIAGLILATILITGCQTTNTIERADSRATPDVVSDHRVTTDSSLNSKARVLQVRQTTVGNNLLKIQVEILNTTLSRKQINYRFDWIDDSGMTVNTSMSHWKRLSLAGKESIWISAVAPSPKVVDFRLKLIEPSN